MTDAVDVSADGRTVLGVGRHNTQSEAWIATIPHQCWADFNNSSRVDAQDIFDFIGAWFAADPRADLNGGGLSVQDIFDFLNAWLAGC